MKTPIHFSDDDGTVPIYFDADGEQCAANEVVRRCNAFDPLIDFIRGVALAGNPIASQLLATYEPGMT